MCGRIYWQTIIMDMNDEMNRKSEVNEILAPAEGLARKRRWPIQAEPQAAALKSPAILEFNVRTAFFRQCRISDSLLLETLLRLSFSISCQYSISAWSRKRLEDSISFAHIRCYVLTQQIFRKIILIIQPGILLFAGIVSPPGKSTT